MICGACVSVFGWAFVEVLRHFDIWDLTIYFYRYKDEGNEGNTGKCFITIDLIKLLQPLEHVCDFQCHYH